MAGLILPYKGTLPTIGREVFVAPNATVIGNVILGDHSSLWFGVVLRGDVGTIRVGARTNIQDLTVVHVTGGRFDTTIGANVLIGHACILHGCELKDGAFIGMGATLLDGVVVEEDAMVAAGSLVTPGKVVKSGELWSGRPARFVRTLPDEERAGFQRGVQHYVDAAQTYMAAGIGRP